MTGSTKADFVSTLARSLERRLEARRDTDAYRLFHGPGEGEGIARAIAIDIYGDWAWITAWEGKHLRVAAELAALREPIETFLRELGVRGAVTLYRPERGTPAPPALLFGDIPAERFVVTEDGLRFWIDFRESLHPGLFLDHRPLRRWIRAHSSGRRLCNLFSYTGSLSMAAAAGGAHFVKSVDLSRPFSNWARDNWDLNGFDPARSDFVVGDALEWLPKFARRDERFDCIVIDPPSFARTKRRTFSTSRDLVELHSLAVACLDQRGGIIASSINSAKIPAREFEAQVLKAIAQAGRRARLIERVAQPDTFPTRSDDQSTRYLKGVIVEVS